MGVGAQGSKDTIDSALLNLSVGMRNMMQGITNLSTWVNGQGDGMDHLAALGYSTAPTATNPGGVSDAQLAQNMISYLNTMAQIYFGGATQPTAFDFNNELSQLWAGQ